MTKHPKIYFVDGSSIINGGLSHSAYAIFNYKCSDFYHQEDEKTLLWNDPDVGIKWHTMDPILSDKDKQGILLKDLKF